MHSFTTERLSIRLLTEQDKNLYISLYTDAKIMRNIGEPLSIDNAEKAFRKTLKAIKKEKPTVMTWAIVSLENNNCIGIQALNWQNSGTPEIGIMLLRHSNGKLLPEEAMGSLMEYAFNNLSINTINASYAKKNLATKRFVKKLGFISMPASPSQNSNSYYDYVNKEQWRKQLITCKNK